MDLRNLTRMTNVHERGRQDYHLRYSEKTEKFKLSDLAFEQLQIPHKSLDPEIDPDGIVALVVVPEGMGALKKRRGDMNKTQEFRAKKLRRYLDAGELNGVNEFALIPSGIITVRDEDGNVDHHKYVYEIAEWEDEYEDSDPLLEQDHPQTIDMYPSNGHTAEAPDEMEETIEEEPEPEMAGVAEESVETVSEATEEEEEEVDFDNPFE